jgi:hypothetical protein
MNEETISTWNTVYKLAVELEDQPKQLAALRALWTFDIRKPDVRGAMALAHRHAEIAGRVSDDDAIVTSAWMIGTAAHQAGEFVSAREHLERFLSRETHQQRLDFIDHSGFDRRSAGRAILSMSLWILGHADLAVQNAKLAVEEARGIGHALPLCEAMFWSGYARLYAGADLRSLEQSAQDLSDFARRHSLDAHWAVGVALRGLCRSRLMNFEGAVSALTEGIQGLVTAHYGPVTPLLMAELAHARAKLGEVGAGLDVIARCEAEKSHTDIWCMAEHL